MTAAIHHGGMTGTPNALMINLLTFYDWGGCVYDSVHVTRWHSQNFADSSLAHEPGILPWTDGQMPIYLNADAKDEVKKITIVFFAYKQWLSSIDNKTKVVQRVPSINMRIFNSYFEFNFNFLVPSFCLTFRIFFCKYHLWTLYP